jgi:histidinol-phosphate aminotransferase
VITVGLGASSGVSAEEVLAAVDAVLPAAPSTVRLATLDARAQEPGVREAAGRRGWAVVGHPAAALAAVTVPSPSQRVASAVGTASVAEAAALLHGGPILVPKTVHGRVTVAVAGPDHGTQAPGLHHHGDAELGPGLRDLAVNVRGDAPPEWLRAVLHASVEDAAAYPDPGPARDAVAAAHGRPVEEVLLAAGAAEVFVLLARALRPRLAAVVHPSFTEPEAALRAAGHPVTRVVLRAEDGWRLDPSAVPEDADLVVLGNPTNPTSVLHPAADVAALARPGRVLVVDEAFADTVPGEPESLASRRDLPGLLVVRSLTKTWGLAGLRVGYALGSALLVARLGAQQPHWPVSTPALAALAACSAPSARTEAEAAAADLDRRRAALLAALPSSVTVEGAPRSSFVLLRVPDGQQVRHELRRRGWAVRRGDTFPGLTPDHLRVAVRSAEVSAAFASDLAAALTSAPTARDVP